MTSARSNSLLRQGLAADSADAGGGAARKPRAGLASSRQTTETGCLQHSWSTGSDGPPLLVWNGWRGSAGTGRDLLVVRKAGAAAAVTIDLLVASCEADATSARSSSWPKATKTCKFANPGSRHPVPHERSGSPANFECGSPPFARPGPPMRGNRARCPALRWYLRNQGRSHWAPGRKSPRSLPVSPEAAASFSPSKGYLVLIAPRASRRRACSPSFKPGPANALVPC